MEIKYEAVFGDQSLFDGAIFGSIAVISNDSIKVYFNDYDKFLIEVMKCNDLPLPELPAFAMRRIIPEPKRWTKADQLEGKLPPIGSKYIAGGDKRELTCLFHGKGNGTIRIIGFDSDDEVTGFEIQYCHPIETPEEKAQRERNEWAKKASNWIDADADGVNLVSVLQMRRFYDALKSGELPMPNKE